MPEPTAQRTHSPHPAGARPGWCKRLPWLPILITLAVILSSGLAVQPVRDAASLGDVPEAYLSRSFGYVALAPLSDVLDTLTLLSAQQHLALLCGVLVLFVAWRGLKAAYGGATWRGHLVSGAVLFVSLLAVYAAGALLPRPMAALEADDANIVRVDFHSHTDASHDGRQTVEQNRAWHRGAGFNVAYITDHASVAGAERGVANDPAVAGQDVTLLQAIEVTWSGEHVGILGAQRTYTGLLTPNLRDVDVEGLRIGSMIPGREPVVIWHHPHRLDRLPLAVHPLTPGIRAIEVVNGAPADMGRVRRNRAAEVAMAQQNNLALTTGSDNHGWGRTAPGWTVMRIYGWRGMSPDALAQRIEATLRAQGFGATRVVERRVADPGDRRLELAASIATVPARMLTTLSNDERIAWLIWTWAITGAVWFIRRRRASA